MRATQLLIAMFLIAVCAGCTGVSATNGLKNDTSAECPRDSAELPVQALYGSWQVRFNQTEEEAEVALHRNPDYAGSVRGTITRGAQVAQLAGDITDEGALVLDESEDGRAISAVWSGELDPTSCGKQFKGTWRNAINDSTRSFSLRRLSAAP